MEEQLKLIETAELEVERRLVLATTDDLMECAKTFNIQDVTAETRVSVVLRKVRKHIEGTVDAFQEEGEKLAFLQGVVKSFNGNFHTPSGVQSPLVKNEVPTPAEFQEQLTAALRKAIPKPEPATVNYKQPFKIIGVVGDNKEKNQINYTNLLSQVNDGKAAGYKITEITSAVKKSVAPGSHLRTYLDTKSSLDLTTMLEMIRSFFRERTSDEMFTELGNLRQTEMESPTDFLIRALQLREKVIAASKCEGGNYTDQLVYSTFARSVRTGLTNDQVRAHMKQHLDPRNRSSDAELLQEMNHASAEHEETSSKARKNVKKVQVNEGRVVSHDDLSPIIQGITMLRQQMEELKTANQKDNSKPSFGRGRSDQRNSSQRTPARSYSDTSRQSPAPTYKCRRCQENNVYRCQHCFQCGSDDHQKRQCPQKNGVRQ